MYGGGAGCMCVYVCIYVFVVFSFTVVYKVYWNQETNLLFFRVLKKSDFLLIYQLHVIWYLFSCFFFVVNYRVIDVYLPISKRQKRYIRIYKCIYTYINSPTILFFILLISSTRKKNPYSQLVWHVKQKTFKFRSIFENVNPFSS